MEDDNLIELQDKIRLTKHYDLHRDFQPLYTGGQFKILKDEQHALSLRDGKICLFSIETSKVLASLSQENEDILTFAISPNQQLLAISNKNYLIRLYKVPESIENFSQLEELSTFKTINQMVLEMNFDPSSKFLAAGTADSHIKVFDVRKGFQTHNLTGHRGIITNLIFHPEIDSLRLISTAEDLTIKVWDLVMKTEIANLKFHQALITNIIFSTDMNTLAASSKDGSVSFWNVKDNYKLLSSIKVKSDENPDEIEELNAIYMFKSGSEPYILIGGQNGILKIYDIKAQKFCYSLHDNTLKSEITKIISSENSSKIYVLNADQNFNIYQITNKTKKSSSSNKPQLKSLVSKCLYLDEIIDLKLLGKKSDIEGDQSEPQYAVLCSNNETLKIINLQDGQVSQYGGHNDIILCLDVSRDLILSGSKDNQIRLWKINQENHELKCLATFSGHTENIASVCFAPKKSNFFVSASQDNTIKIWDIQEFKKTCDGEDIQEITSALLTVMGHQKYINVVKVSPNDKLIASSSQDKTIKIWGSYDLMLQQTLSGHKKGVWDIAFSPVDKLLVSASGDKTLKVWNLQNGTCISTFQGHQNSLVKISWINLGMQIVSTSVDGVVKIWNLKKQICVNTIQMHEEKIWALDSNEKFMVTGGGDSTVKIWKDCTVEKEQEEKEKELQKVQDEQRLSKLIREEDFQEAAVMAFRLNRLRDFYLVMNKVISGKSSKIDMVDSVLTDRKILNSLQSGQQNQQEKSQQIQGETLMTQILAKLLKEDKKRLLEIIRNLNSKSQYQGLAQHILYTILPRFRADDYLEEFKTNQNELKEILKITDFYSQKHLDRAERGLKKAFYPQYILSQMTLQDDLLVEQQKQSAKQQDKQNSEKKQNAAYQQKDTKQIQQLLNLKKKRKQRERGMSDNLFTEIDSKSKQSPGQNLAKRVKA
ncbi:transducin beta-like protein 3 [Stylonychia lemnae]|uniref:Transducin beta-like protein 3 n=1 Tax=Stylonychia lemnae TaxID=5949 RepID=A0A078B6E7_STYLE|nr:transducin beta-like protein 3 [Stylonychia lemnae]|eukprot:CDW89939.1 transducin beta-like protein 3 [Stylonychia lemnae]